VAAKDGRLRTCCGKDFSETPGLQRRRLRVRPDVVATRVPDVPSKAGGDVQQNVVGIAFRTDVDTVNVKVQWR
jgi:hypothetical protein